MEYGKSYRQPQKTRQPLPTLFRTLRLVPNVLSEGHTLRSIIIWSFLESRRKLPLSLVVFVAKYLYSIQVTDILIDEDDSYFLLILATFNSM